MSEGSGKDIFRRMQRMLPKRFLSTTKVICDWGCGKGSFAKGLVKKGHTVYGYDQNEVISQISQNLDRFICTSNSKIIRDNEIDFVYSLEVIEHIIESEIQKTFCEWRRILKKNGYLLLTTPNDENLESNSIICPNCETQFHTVQHVRSFTIESISKMLDENGFRVEKVWLGEFFFDTKRGFVIKALRKVRFVIRKSRERRNRNSKQPHMMVLCKQK